MKPRLAVENAAAGGAKLFASGVTVTKSPTVTFSVSAASDTDGVSVTEMLSLIVGSVMLSAGSTVMLSVVDSGPVSA